MAAFARLAVVGIRRPRAMAIAGARFASNRTRVVAQYICRGVDVVALHHRMTKQW